MLKTTGIVRLGADAEVRTVGEQDVISVRGAHSEKYKDKNGEQQEKTTWVALNIWREKGKAKAADYMKKGTQLYFEGVPEAKAYTNKEGQPEASLNVRVSYFEFVGSKQETQPQTAAASGSNKPKASSQSFDDEY